MQTIKDVHSLPQTEEMLDCLNGAEWFTSLDLKSGYWQVEMEENSKALTTFTVGLLGFHECEGMPFGLTNAPATFQHLMQSCLRQSTSTILYHIILMISLSFPKHQKDIWLDYETFSKNSRKLN